MTPERFPDDVWDQKQISEGIPLLTAALSKGSIGAYQLQAAIAAGGGNCALPHCRRPDD